MTQDTLLITHTDRFHFAVSFNGVDYKPTSDTTAIGALVFALKPRKVLVTGPQAGEFKLMADIAVATLKGHTRGRTMPEAALERWRWAAIDLAPDAASAADTMWSFDEAIRLKGYAVID